MLWQDLIDQRLTGQSFLFGSLAQPAENFRIEPDGDQLSRLIIPGTPLKVFRLRRRQTPDSHYNCLVPIMSCLKSICALIADDSENDALLLVRELSRAGLHTIFHRVSTPKELLDALAKQTWDIIFSDHSMPEFQGTSTLEVLQKSGHYIPLVVVSGSMSEELVAAAIKAGAAGFVRKQNLSKVIPPVRNELQKTEERHRRLLAGDQSVAVKSDADIRTARQMSYELAILLGFPPGDAALVATAISELARNIVLCAGKGRIVFGTAREGDRRGLSAVASDDGPGIPDVEQAVSEGYSTARGLGMGLPGVKRVVDKFEITSEVGRGTTIKIKKWKV